MITSTAATTWVADPALSPKMAFGNGSIVNNQAATYAALPNMSGAQSAWTVVQWHKAQYLDPSQTLAAPADTEANGLGNALDGWETADGNTSLQIFAATDGSDVIHLQSSNGVLTPAGGANLFLQTAVAPNTTFASTLVYSMQARISDAAVAYTVPAAALTGVVQAVAFTGFTVAFNAIGSANYDATLPTYNAFLQIELAGSRGEGTYRSGCIAANGNATLCDTTLLPQNSLLPFQASDGGLTTETYNLNAYLADMVAQSWSLNGPNGSQAFTMNAAADNLANWTLGTVYVGLETQNAGTDGVVQGSDTIGLDIGHVALTATPAGVSAAAPAQPHISANYNLTRQDDGTTVIADPRSGAVLTTLAAGTPSYQFDDATFCLTLTAAQSAGLNPALLRDYDGNNLGAPTGWQLMGVADVTATGAASYILTNPSISRWAEVQPTANGSIDMTSYGAGGATRVVGIYIDPYVAAGIDVRFGPYDSQARFQNDLAANDLRLLGSGNYDNSGFKDCWFKVMNGNTSHADDTYLRAIMWNDGNIQYANYVNVTQMENFMATNHIAPAVYKNWEAI